MHSSARVRVYRTTCSACLCCAQYVVMLVLAIIGGSGGDSGGVGEGCEGGMNAGEVGAAMVAKEAETFPLSLTLAHVGATCFFGYAGYVQQNDPDAAEWMVMYGAAAVISLCYATRILQSRILPALCTVACMLRLAVLVWNERSKLSELDRMSFMTSEFGRESSGLILVTLWMLFLWKTSGRQVHVVCNVPHCYALHVQGSHGVHCLVQLMRVLV
eukprot:jgi/Chlat1/2620/Chrsp178S02502